MHVSVFLDGQPVLLSPPDPRGRDWVWYDPQDGSTATGRHIAPVTDGHEITTGRRLAQAITHTGTFPVNERTDAAGRGRYLGIAG